MGKQPKLAVVYRGKGKRISANEKLAWHPDVDVFRQDNALLDQNFCMDWFTRSLSPFLQQEGISKFVLLLDNLTGQMQNDFKEAMSGEKELLWHGLPDATDLWQPVGVGFAAC